MRDFITLAHPWGRRNVEFSASFLLICVCFLRSFADNLYSARVTASGCIFISVDYRLLPPSTGHDVLTDIKDLFRFLVSEFNPQLHPPNHTADNQTDEHRPGFVLDINAIAVAGSSAGGLCAYLAAMHVSPRPRAVASFYGLGGNFLVS